MNALHPWFEVPDNVYYVVHTRRHIQERASIEEGKSVYDKIKTSLRIVKVILKTSCCRWMICLSTDMNIEYGNIWTHVRKTKVLNVTLMPSLNIVCLPYIIYGIICHMVSLISDKYASTKHHTPFSVQGWTEWCNFTLHTATYPYHADCSKRTRLFTLPKVMS